MMVSSRLRSGILDLLVEDCGVDPSQMNRANNEESGNAFFIVIVVTTAGAIWSNKYWNHLSTKVVTICTRLALDLVNKNSRALSIFRSSSYIRDDLLQLVTFLINEKGIIENACDTDGWNALHLLCTSYSGSQFDEIVSFLCTKGIDLNQLTYEEYDAIFLRLHRASYKFSSLKGVEILINI